MRDTCFNLQTLLDPIDPEAFFHQYWEKEPLLIARGKRDYYNGLLSSADVDQVIAFTRPKFADGGAFSQEPPRARTFVQGWLADRPLHDNVRFAAVDDLQRVYAQGKTVILMTMQQRWRPVAALCRALEAVFHCPVHANMYLTPEGAQGFDAHFDTHEVLVLQLEGAKTWRLYGSARALPLVDERFNVPKDQMGPPREVRLEPGDLLYLPRGHVHEAFTADCASLHLTIGINVYRWSDVLHEALAELTRRDERLRASIPRGLLSSEALPGAVGDQFQTLLALLARDARAGDAFRHLGDQFFGQLATLPDGRFAPAADGAELDLDTVLEKRAGALGRVIVDGGWVVLEFPGGRVGGPLKIAAALEWVARADRFAVRALPDSLGDEGKQVLARRLVREGFLRCAGPEESPGNGAQTHAAARGAL